MNKQSVQDQTYFLGIDVGSTTLKTAVIDPATHALKYSRYERHNAKQAETAVALLEDVQERFPHARFKVAVCGSGGKGIANAIQTFFIQEVVANAIAIREYHPEVRVAIELGGQDAKVIFFEPSEASERLSASDLRMNGSCAGGTGAFIDQMAEIIDVRPEEFGQVAARGKIVHAISGRCGVFAKTDIQPLLNQGVPIEDIALSCFHAIAKQTIGGLAQGAEIHPPVVFEGGPLTFNPKLIEVFAERLELKSEEVIIPEHPEVIVACGAALSVKSAYAAEEGYQALGEAIAALKAWKPQEETEGGYEKFFANEEDHAAFRARHQVSSPSLAVYHPGETVEAYLGIDAGSTTSKLVLLDPQGKLIDKFYANNAGDPLRIVKNALIELKKKFERQNITLKIKGVGTTGYGELLFAKAFKADYHTVETVAHAEAALDYAPDVSFILDIGGQDMKAISIREGVITEIVLNEACSAGCGSFIETYAKSLRIPVEQVSDLAFRSEAPCRLGSRCTVFMNSCIVTEQRNGKTTEDIMAGLCKSIVENVFTKVVRVSNFAQLGNKVLVQGGTFKNDAVLRALEQYTDREILRAPLPGEMGALGIALLTKKYVEEQERGGKGFESSFIGLDRVEHLTFEKKAGEECPFCSNNCSRMVVAFGNGDYFVTGNRCERGEVLGTLKDAATLDKIRAINAKLTSVPDVFKLRNILLLKDYHPAVLAAKRQQKIGIPLVLEFWNSLPFWKAFFTSLGYEVVLSSKSSYPQFENGLKYIPSDTVCFPAKLVHGHIQDLVAKGVDRIFMPVMNIIKLDDKDVYDTVHMCAVVQGYPIIVKENDEPENRWNVPLDSPSFHWYSNKLRNSQLIAHFEKEYGLPKAQIQAAIMEGDRAMDSFHSELEVAGQEVLESLTGTDEFAVLLAGRPYHHDELVSHEISALFTSLGVPVLCMDSLPEIRRMDLSGVRPDLVNPFHTGLFAAAKLAAKHPNLQVAQIVSFGCGHEAVNTDEMARILNKVANKQLLVLKVDEGEATGPLKIRIKSFVETIRMRRRSQPKTNLAPLGEAFEVKFNKQDKRMRKILIPNLSEAFSTIASGVLKAKGFLVETLPLADAKAKELGKKYVHNDICYPAQINIGEMLAVLEKGQYQPSEVAFGVAKNCDDCRAGQYAVLARKALDEAGYSEIPIVTTGNDTKGMHPGINMGLWFQLGMLYGLTMTDALEEMVRRIRPYEITQGITDRLFKRTIQQISEALETSHQKAVEVFAGAIKHFNAIPIDTSQRKPRVLVIGEILMNYHPSANEEIIQYLESSGMETTLPSMVNFFRRDLVRVKEGVKRGLLPNPWLQWALSGVTDWMYGRVIGLIDEKMKAFKFYEPKKSIHELAELSTEYMDKTFTIGEGWAIPTEITEHALHGVDSFAIVQPFGCLPNHITGRGMMKALKKRFPHIKIISLDYDADTSFANIENRLQMLVMAQKEGVLT